MRRKAGRGRFRRDPRGRHRQLGADRTAECAWIRGPACDHAASTRAWPASHDARDGFAKILDFGLAKLTERQGAAIDPDAPTRMNVRTDPGMVMGTANYMSPEQARGLKVDGRTDIWSLGVLIYEMVAGRVPFEGETPSDVIALILQTEAPPLVRYAPDTPAELQRIVDKSLTKNRDERYQTVKDLLIDLRRLSKRLDFENELQRSTSPESTSGGTVAA